MSWQTRAQPSDRVTCTGTDSMVHHWRPCLWSQYSGCQSVAIRVHLASSSMSVELSPSGWPPVKERRKKPQRIITFLFKQFPSKVASHCEFPNAQIGSIILHLHIIKYMYKLLKKCGYLMFSYKGNFKKMSLFLTLQVLLYI